MASERSEDTTKGPKVSISGRSHWMRYLTNLECSNSNYTGNSGSVEELSSDKLVETSRTTS